MFNDTNESMSVKHVCHNLIVQTQIPENEITYYTKKGKVQSVPYKAIPSEKNDLSNM